MRIQLSKIVLAASVLLALAFTFSCDSASITNEEDRV